VTNRILDDLASATKPRYMRLTARFYVRGGIFTTVVAEHRQKGWTPAPTVQLAAFPSQSSTRAEIMSIQAQLSDNQLLRLEQLLGDPCWRRRCALTKLRAISARRFRSAADPRVTVAERGARRLGTNCR
jgi:hypothetical protein